MTGPLKVTGKHSFTRCQCLRPQHCASSPWITVPVKMYSVCKAVERTLGQQAQGAKQQWEIKGKEMKLLLTKCFPRHATSLRPVLSGFYWVKGARLFEN